jgi:hypothetical protein
MTHKERAARWLVDRDLITSFDKEYMQHLEDTLAAHFGEVESVANEKLEAFKDDWTLYANENNKIVNSLLDENKKLKERITTLRTQLQHIVTHCDHDSAEGSGELCDCSTQMAIMAKRTLFKDSVNG